jgi:hypothetical protein
VPRDHREYSSFIIIIVVTIRRVHYYACGVGVMMDELYQALVYYYEHVYPARFVFSLLRLCADATPTGDRFSMPECMAFYTNERVINHVLPHSPVHLVRLLCGHMPIAKPVLDEAAVAPLPLATGPAVGGLHFVASTRASAHESAAAADNALSSAMTARDHCTNPFPLVFDFDMSDSMPPVRPCHCTGKALCERCWQTLAASVKLSDWILHNVCGLERVLCVFSGKRGVHVHCFDRNALLYDEVQRRCALEHVAYAWMRFLPRVLDVFNNANERALESCESLQQFLRLHAALSLPHWWFDAYDRVLWPHFAAHWTRAHALDANDEQCYFQLAALLASLHSDTTSALFTTSNAASGSIHSVRRYDVKRCGEKCQTLLQWRQQTREFLMSSSADATTTPTEAVNSRRCEIFMLVVLFTCIAPDAKVTTHLTHPIRLPFSPHASTNRLAVPLCARTAHLFRPLHDSLDIYTLLQQRCTHESIALFLDTAREALACNRDDDDDASRANRTRGVELSATIAPPPPPSTRNKR